MNDYKPGQDIEPHQLSYLPVNTIVWDLDRKVPRVRAKGMYVFTDEGPTSSSSKYRIIDLAQDLTDVDTLALELHNAGRAKSDSYGIDNRADHIDESSNAKYYRAAARFVLENFEVKR